MKKTVFSVLAFFLVAVIFMACEKKSDDGDEPDPTPNPDVTVESVSAKWNVLDVGREHFESFEFNNSGQYIVQRVNGEYAYGNYNIQSTGGVILEGFGTISDINLTETNFDFMISLLSKSTNEDIQVKTAKQDEIPSTGNTYLLCRTTWDLIEVNGEPVYDTSYWALNVLFSEAGTYFVEWVNEPGNGGLAEWIWKDDNQDIFCYSWDGDPTCTGYNEATVEVSQNELIIEDAYYHYVFEPMEVTKSMIFSKEDAYSPGPAESLFGQR